MKPIRTSILYALSMCDDGLTPSQLINATGGGKSSVYMNLDDLVDCGRVRRIIYHHNLYVYKIKRVKENG